jgi:hypothetical protein
MAGTPTSVEVLRETLAAVQRHGSVAGAALALGLSRSTFANRHREAVRRHALGELGDPSIVIDGETEMPRRLPFEREWQLLMKEVGMARDRYAGPARPKPQIGRMKIVAAGDFHAPFHDRAAVAAMLERERDADVLLVGGDFGDAHCASTFTKYEHVSYTEEFAAMTSLFQAFSERFPRVVFLEGSNHSDRFEKRLRENLSKDMLDAIQSMTGGHLNPVLALAKRYPNVEIAGWRTPSGQKVSWLTVLGDVAFTHAEKYSRVAGATLRSIEEWVDDFTGTLGLPKLRAIFQFHTHTASLFPYKSDMLLVEPGCMCQVHTYQLGARLGGRPQRLAYATLELVDGALDVNSVRLHWLKGDVTSNQETHDG